MEPGRKRVGCVPPYANASCDAQADAEGRDAANIESWLTIQKFPAENPASVISKVALLPSAAPAHLASNTTFTEGSRDWQ
jgi:hypothetical protein